MDCHSTERGLFTEEADGRQRARWSEALNATCPGVASLPPGTVFGDFDPQLLHHPNGLHNVRTMAEQDPEFRRGLRLITMLREPARHCLSFARRHLSDPTALDALCTDPAVCAHFLQNLHPTDLNFNPCRWSPFVARLFVWMEALPEVPLLFIQSEELFSSPLSVVRAVENFLGLPPLPDAHLYNHIANRSPQTLAVSTYTLRTLASDYEASVRSVEKQFRLSMHWRAEEWCFWRVLSNWEPANPSPCQDIANNNGADGVRASGSHRSPKRALGKAFSKVVPHPVERKGRAGDGPLGRSENGVLDVGLQGDRREGWYHRIDQELNQLLPIPPDTRAQ
eukprot:CAMPEP_0119136374 /NCGR_PEP_ID=MMETSP1310-20130426/21282_1 /TAXON_ID=464262 /ORGANISM="Genus nov. species nov., Strain RCC2339" /LENGTH=336 /DNA_ID=CAMNT_0007127357 /DNA_START=341 /DNA_END=1351 /DNA_ORIENTATION=+